MRTNPARVIIRAPYISKRASKWLSTRTKIPTIVLPYTVGGSDTATDLFGLFDDTIAKLIEHAS